MYQLTERLRLSLPTAQVSGSGGAQHSLTHLTFALSTPIPKLMVATITGIFSSIHSFWIEVLSAALSPGKGKRGKETTRTTTKEKKKRGFSSSSIPPLQANPLTKTDWCTHSSLPMFKLACAQAEVSGSSCFYSKEKNSDLFWDKSSCYI